MVCVLLCTFLFLFARLVVVVVLCLFLFGDVL